MTTPDAVATADALAQIPGVSLRRGRFVGLSDDLLPLVDMGDSRFPCEFGTDYIPQVNEPVQVLTIGPQHLLLPQGAKPKVGTVVTVSSPLVTVQTSIGDEVAIFMGDAPTSGQRVMLEWTEDGPVVVGVLSTTPTAAPPAPDPTPPSGLHRAVFRATAAGSTDRFQARWWTSNPYASTSTYGAWFYGNAIKGTIPAGAQFESLRIKVNRTQDQGGQPRWVLHDAGAPTDTLPGFSSPYVEWDPPNGWQVPPDPAGWFNALKAGGPYAGVGLNQGGYNIFASLAQDAESGALDITWRT